MSHRGKTRDRNRSKRWMLIVGLFLIVQLIFFIIDGTSLEPNLNGIGKSVLDLPLFTEWITPYSFSFFNMCLVIHVIIILGQILNDSVSVFLKRKEG